VVVDDEAFIDWKFFRGIQKQDSLTYCNFLFGFLAAAGNRP
jgi:hypothetical protein